MGVLSGGYDAAPVAFSDVFKTYGRAQRVGKRCFRINLYQPLRFRNPPAFGYAQ